MIHFFLNFCSRFLFFCSIHTVQKESSSSLFLLCEQIKIRAISLFGIFSTRPNILFEWLSWRDKKPCKENRNLRRAARREVRRRTMPHAKTHEKRAQNRTGRWCKAGGTALSCLIRFSPVSEVGLCVSATREFAFLFSLSNRFNRTRAHCNVLSFPLVNSRSLSLTENYCCTCCNSNRDRKHVPRIMRGVSCLRSHAFSATAYASSYEMRVYLRLLQDAIWNVRGVTWQRAMLRRSITSDICWIFFIFALSYKII